MHGLGDICVVGGHIGWMEWVVVYDGIPPDNLLQPGYQCIDRDRLMPPKVDDLEAQWFQSQDGSTCDVVNVGESTRLLSGAIHPHRLPFADPLSESEHRHIRATGGSVNCEITKNGDINTVEIMICVA